MRKKSFYKIYILWLNSRLFLKLTFMCLIMHHHPRIKNVFPLGSSKEYCWSRCRKKHLFHLWIWFSSDPSLTHAWLSVIPWTAACQASLSITNSWSLLTLMSLESVMPSKPSYPLSAPSPPAFSLSPHQGLFQWVSSSHQVAKVLEFQLQHQSLQWIFRTDFL